MNIVELRFNSCHQLQQAVVHYATTVAKIVAQEYPGKVHKLEKDSQISMRLGTRIPKVFKVEDSTTGMFGTVQLNEYSLLVELP